MNIENLALATEQFLTSNIILGMNHASSILVASDNYIPAVSYKAAINSIKSKIPLSKKEWLELEPKLRFRAFTIAELASYDMIN